MKSQIEEEKLMTQDVIRKEEHPQEKIKEDRWETSTKNTLEVLRYLKEEMGIEIIKQRSLRELVCDKHGYFLICKLIYSLIQQLHCIQKFKELFPKKLLITTKQLKRPLHPMHSMCMNFIMTTNNFISILQYLVKSQEKYYGIKIKFMDEYFSNLKDKVKRDKEHLPKSLQETDEVEELKSAIDDSNRETLYSVMLWEELTMNGQTMKEEMDKLNMKMIREEMELKLLESSKLSPSELLALHEHTMKLSSRLGSSSASLPPLHRSK